MSKENLSLPSYNNLYPSDSHIYVPIIVDSDSSDNSDQNNNHGKYLKTNKCGIECCLLFFILIFGVATFIVGFEN